MHTPRELTRIALFILSFTATTLCAQGQLLWTVGMDDNGWPLNQDTPGDGGGPNATFVQEAGTNPLPGDPASPELNQQADDDYYFEGTYTTAISSVIAESGDYTPVGVVAANEEAVERAFAGTDNDKRYHFNLPGDLTPTDLLSVTFDMVNLDTGGGADPRYGIEVYVNDVKVQDEIIIRPTQLGIAYTTPQFTLQSVNAEVGPGFDNMVRLKGINYGADGGGQWMGIDYIQLNHDTEVIPAPVFPIMVGTNDNTHIRNGLGGGPNTSFMQENGSVNPLPGSPTSPAIDKAVDNDYYFAGSYTKVIPANGTYTPVGTVATDEKAAERAFAGDDTEQRYHFNLPNTMLPTDLVAVSFDALDLEDPSATVTDPRWGVEVYMNGVKVQDQIIIRPAQLDKTYTTPQFTLKSVNAGFGPGTDNILTLKGISYANSGGGGWMGIDYVTLDRVTTPIPNPILPWSVGMDDNDWPVGTGGGTNANFVANDGTQNALPGNPAGADNDYYFGGLYTTVIPGNGSYGPVGTVGAPEEDAERGFSGADNEQRYHFNLPAVLKTNDLLSVTFDASALDATGTDPRYGVEVYVNGVLVGPQVLIRTADLDTDFTTPKFTAASVNAMAGPGFDNIVTLKGVSFAGSGGGNSLGLDFVRLNVHPKSTFPWAAGRDDDIQEEAGMSGGGLEAAFVQENGSINPLPGSPFSEIRSGGADNDYYFAGDYTTTIPSVVAESGDYTPVGAVLVSEDAAERAFAGADNDLRFHFNLPETLQPTDQLSVAYEPISLDNSGGAAQYGIEVYVNGVQVQDEVLITPDGLFKDYTTPHFTLQSVNAGVGPGYDNIVSLRGINYNATSGGNWMGFDYVRLNKDPLPLTLPIIVGADDNGHPFNATTPGDGGGPTTTFVQENGNSNPLPGNPDSREVDQRADDDYYFAGIYTNTLANVINFYNDYTPTGIISTNEEAAERAFAGTDNEKRYHFNLPANLKPTNTLVVTYDMVDLDTTAATPHYGVEVYFNGILVAPERVITPTDLGTAFSTDPFTLESVGAEAGPGYDNIVTLRGVNYSASEAGGGWMGIDYVKVDGPAAVPLKFSSSSVSNGKITLSWTGAGTLEWAPSVLGTWTPVSPAPNGTYTENIVAGQNRFYRLKAP